MLNSLARIFGVFLLLAIASSTLCAQKPVQAASAQQAVAMAQKGRCTEALPALKAARVTDKQLRYDVLMSQARCSISIDDPAAAAAALARLRHDFPHDPETLYLSAHYFSQLADRSAQELASTAKDSPQFQKLNAEALESQGKWDEASAVYRQILERDPKTPDIHYRLAQIILNQPATPTQTDDARKELEQELQVNPSNAAAEFMLGEIARRAGQWEDAIRRFSAASKLDAGFSEAYLALGMSLNSAGKHADAIPPLERYIKMQSEDPAGHYQLAMAYARTGNKQAAERESEVQRKLAEKNNSNIH